MYLLLSYKDAFTNELLIYCYTNGISLIRKFAGGDWRTNFVSNLLTGMIYRFDKSVVRWNRTEFQISLCLIRRMCVLSIWRQSGAWNIPARIIIGKQKKWNSKQTILYVAIDSKLNYDFCTTYRGDGDVTHTFCESASFRVDYRLKFVSRRPSLAFAPLLHSPAKDFPF